MNESLIAGVYLPGTLEFSISVKRATRPAMTHVTALTSQSRSRFTSILSQPRPPALCHASGQRVRGWPLFPWYGD